MTPFDAATMREHAFDERERMARAAFDIPTVVALIKTAATAGRTDIRIVQDNRVDLSITKPALKLTAWLQARGFKVGWKAVEIMERVKGRPTQLTFKFFELLVDWSDSDSLGGLLSRVPELGISATIDSPTDKNFSPPLANDESSPNT